MSSRTSRHGILPRLLIKRTLLDNDLLKVCWDQHLCQYGCQEFQSVDQRQLGLQTLSAPSKFARTKTTSDTESTFIALVLTSVQQLCSHTVHIQISDSCIRHHWNKTQLLFDSKFWKAFLFWSLELGEVRWDGCALRSCAARWEEPNDWRNVVLSLIANDTITPFTGNQREFPHSVTWV